MDFKSVNTIIGPTLGHIIYKQQKNLVLCIILASVWILDYMSPLAQLISTRVCPEYRPALRCDKGTGSQGCTLQL